jgi:hypothetical protein
MLHGLEPDAVVESLDELPRRAYSLRISLAGELGKPLLLPARLCERAPQQPWAERILRSILRSHVLTLRASNNLHQSRLILHGISETACAICARPVPPDEPPFYRGGGLVHVRCFSASPEARPPH